MTTEQRLTAEREKEIREKVCEWGRLMNERPQRFAHTKTTLAVGYLLDELDAVRRERNDARKDSARLDFLERAPCNVVYVQFPADPNTKYLRDAIDAAMAKDGGA